MPAGRPGWMNAPRIEALEQNSRLKRCSAGRFSPKDHIGKNSGVEEEIPAKNEAGAENTTLCKTRICTQKAA